MIKCLHIIPLMFLLFCPPTGARQFISIVREPFIACVPQCDDASREVSTALPESSDARREPFIACAPQCDDASQEVSAALPESSDARREPSYRMANRIMIIGHGENLRAFSIYGGSRENCLAYASTVRKYNSIFSDSVRVYCMTIPTQGEFYCPEEARPARTEYDAIQQIYSNVGSGVICVDAYSALAAHLDEAVYSRTDHHWQPLGAYYAAAEFAKAAGVPFRGLEDYSERAINGFVGTMARYSRDSEVAGSPEKLVYHIPKNVFYWTEYHDYTLDRRRKAAVSESEARERNFFRHIPDSSAAAYCCFMGGDAKLVKVSTSTQNGRRLLILKDSFGNALPGYLFYSFSCIHIVDCRYFTRNIIDYVRTNRITDILFVNNITHASMSATFQMYDKYLTQ